MCIFTASDENKREHPLKGFVLCSIQLFWEDVGAAAAATATAVAVWSNIPTAEAELLSSELLLAHR